MNSDPGRTQPSRRESGTGTSVRTKVWNIALVGCGGTAALHRHRYVEIPGARLALLVDSNADVARAAAEQLNVERWGTKLEEALAAEIDIVEISTPNYLHAEQAVAAMKAGKHVLLQKPIARSLEEAETIVRTARETGVIAGMYMYMFNNPLFHEIKELIDAGVLGRVSAAHCRGAYRGGLNMPRGNWRNSLEKTGGGSVIQVAIHSINMVQWLLDDKIRRVAAFSKNMMCPTIGGDDVASAAFELESGILGTLSSSYCADQFQLAIYGSKGYVSVTDERRLEIRLDEPYQGDLIQYCQPGKPATTEYDLTDEDLARRSNPHDQHIAFVKAVQEGKPAPISVEAGLADLKVVKAMYRSAEEKKFVEIE